MTVFAPDAIADPCAVTLHVPADKVQLPSDALLVVSVNVTVPPVGVTAGAVVFVTVAVSKVEPVGAMLDGFALTLVAVASMVTVRVVVPLDGS
jgi:hypothetical protein